MKTLTTFTLCTLMIGLTAPICVGKIEEWRDVQGHTFRGEPEDAMGPIALFRSDKTNAAVMVPFHLLSPEDCVRFHEQSKNKPARAEKWKDAKSQVSVDMLRYTLKVSGSNLVPPELDDRREPQFYAVLYSSPSELRAARVIDAVLPIYPKLMQAYPGEVEVLFRGVGQDSSEHLRITTSNAMPWLVTKLNEQARWGAVRVAAPRETPGIVVFHRDGAVVYYVDAVDINELVRPIKQLALLMDTIRPDNPKGWKDRAHYVRSIQPVIHAQGRSDPVLIGNPLQADGLRQRKIHRVEATLSVDAEGKVTAVDLKPDEANLPAAMSAPIATALQRSSVFVAAVENGKFVEGTYRYLLEIPRDSK